MMAEVGATAWLCYPCLLIAIFGNARLPSDINFGEQPLIATETQRHDSFDPRWATCVAPNGRRLGGALVQFG